MTQAVGYGEPDRVRSVYSCCVIGGGFGSQHCYFAFASRDDSFVESAFHVFFKKVSITRNWFEFGLGFWIRLRD